MVICHAWLWYMIWTIFVATYNEKLALKMISIIEAQSIDLPSEFENITWFLSIWFDCVGAINWSLTVGKFPNSFFLRIGLGKHLFQEIFVDLGFRDFFREFQSQMERYCQSDSTVAYAYQREKDRESDIER